MLVSMIVKPISPIFELSWQLTEVTEDKKKENISPVFKKGKKEGPRNYRLLRLNLIPGEVMKKLILEIISSHMQGKK